VGHEKLDYFKKFVTRVYDMRFVHVLLQYFPHAVIHWIQIWRIWRLL